MRVSGSSMRGWKSGAVVRRATGLGVMFLLAAIASQSTVTSVQAGGASFNKLLGSWGGEGRANFAGGNSEYIKCRAYYTGGGEELRMAIRCAGAGGKIEIRSKLRNSEGDALSGTWEERTYNASGTVEGRSIGDSIQLAVTGGGLSGSMEVTTKGRSQQVKIATEGTKLTGVTVDLAKQR